MGPGGVVAEIAVWLIPERLLTNLDASDAAQVCQEDVSGDRLGGVQ